MDFSYSLLGFKCLFGFTSQEISVCMQFRNNTMAITIRITSISLTAWDYILSWVTKTEIIYLKNVKRSNMDGRKEDFNFWTNHRNILDIFHVFFSFFHNQCPVSVRIIQTQKEVKISKRQLKALDRKHDCAATLLRASTTFFKKPPAFVFINNCYNEVS